ncbi:MAG: FAD-dependent oxidoreductase, partial [Pseudomonadota bacterium]
SLKADLCVAGAKQLYAYCEDRGIAHRRTGKLIVATEESDVPALDTIADRAMAAGVDTLRRLTASDISHLEPEVRGIAGLYSPATGIVDSHRLMVSLLGEAEAAGAVLSLATRVVSARLGNEHHEISIQSAEGVSIYRAEEVINCAGLEATALAQHFIGLPPGAVPHPYFCKGSYFAYTGAAPFQRLVYPVPSAAGLGIHATLDLGGQVRFGPDTEWVATVDYTVDPERRADFARAIARYFPAIDPHKLQPGYAGIRPKLHGPGTGPADFRIDGPKDHGIAGLVCLYGIESPGLTAAFAIAERVASMLAPGLTPAFKRQV